MPIFEMIILRSFSGMTAPIDFSMCATSCSVFSTRSPVVARTLTVNWPASLCGKSSVPMSLKINIDTINKAAVALEPVFVLLSRFGNAMLEKACRADRHESRCEQPARPNREDNGFGQRGKQKLPDSADENNRKKNDTDGDGDNGQRPHHFGRPDERGFARRH